MEAGREARKRRCSVRSDGGRRRTSGGRRGRTEGATPRPPRRWWTTSPRRASASRWRGSLRGRPLRAAAASRQKSATAPGPSNGIQNRRTYGCVAGKPSSGEPSRLGRMSGRVSAVRRTLRTAASGDPGAPAGEGGPTFCGTGPDDDGADAWCISKKYQIAASRCNRGDGRARKKREFSGHGLQVRVAPSLRTCDL